MDELMAESGDTAGLGGFEIVQNAIDYINICNQSEA